MFYQGRVVDRNDPKGLGRIRVELPPLYVAPEFSGWIMPFGLFDATEGRGTFFVPKLKANVMIVFILNDSHNQKAARYIVGPWGAPNGVSDVPDETENGNPDITVMAFNGFAIVVDEREGVKKTTFLDRNNGTKIEFDLETKDLTLSTEHDLKQTVKNDFSTTIINDSSDTVGGDKTTQVVGDVQLNCTNNKLICSGDEEKIISGAWKINVTGNVEIKSADSVLLDGATEVKIGASAQDFVAMKTELKLYCNTHTHLIPGVTPGTGSAQSNVALPQLTDAAFTTKTKAE